MLHGWLVLAAHAAGAAPTPADGTPLSGAPMLISTAEDGPLAGPGSTDLYLDLHLNGMPRGLVHFGLRDGRLWASAAALRQLGFRLPAGGPPLVQPASLPGVEVQFDAARQSLALTAPLALLDLPATLLGSSTITTQTANASPGLVLNYDLYGSRAGSHQASLNALTEIRAFSGRTVGSTTALTQTSRSSAGTDWQGRTTRLDTTWSRAFPEDLLALRLGDTLTSALRWSRATRIGGIQLSRNFALQPYQTTAPLSAFMGAATLPSQVELYIDGMRQFNGQLPAGPFQLNAQPYINSTGQAQVVLTDVLGRVTTLDFSLYGTRQLLAKGVSDWSVELGAVRQNYGLRSFDYARDPIASGTWRHGVSDRLMLETHGEATPGLAAAGMGGTWQLGALGMLSGAIAHSRHSAGSGAGSGAQYTLDYSWQNQRLHLGVDGTRTRGDYLDVAAQYGSAPPTSTGRATLGYSTEHLGSFGLGYVYLRYAGQEALRWANLSWSRSWGRSVSTYAHLNQDLGGRRTRTLSAGLSWTLDGGTHLSSSMQHSSSQASYITNAQSRPPSEGGFSWRAGLSEGQSRTGGQAELNYLGRFGHLTGGISVLGDSRSTYASASGGLVVMGGQAFASQCINDAFAVVSTDGLAGVPVKLENRAIGTTDRRGMLLVTPLNAYQNNQLAIDPMQLPANVRLGQTTRIATPSDRAGTLVRFDITPIRAASILLVDAAGQPLPVGSAVRANGQPDEPALVGFDGAVYLDTLQFQNVLAVQTPSGTCQAHFGYPNASDGIPEIGPLHCVTKAAP